MFENTITANFETWDRFHAAYARPIRAAFAILAGDSLADELTQSFFVKLYEKNVLEARNSIDGPFRNWLYVAARHHAIDAFRKVSRRRETNESLGRDEPEDPRARSADRDEKPFDADELYALSVIHLAVGRVRKHLVEEGKFEHWTVFDELTLAPLTPGRVVRSREELLAMFPGQTSAFLDNRLTTVKRVFRRILPAVIPADPSGKLTPSERFQELLDILSASQKNRLWLAFLEAPSLAPGATADASLDLAARSSRVVTTDDDVPEDLIHDELRVLLAFWLEMPFHEYLDGLDPVGATPPRGARAGASQGLNPAATLNLRGLIEGNHPEMPPGELDSLLQKVKTYAKVVHRSSRSPGRAGAARAPARRQSSMPPEVAQVLYNLAGALALASCGSRIVGLEDAQYRKNVAWVLSQPWLDARLRPVFYVALQALGPG
jgi:hypothetical protein